MPIEEVTVKKYKTSEGIVFDNKEEAMASEAVNMSAKCVDDFVLAEAQGKSTKFALSLRRHINNYIAFAATAHLGERNE